MIIDDFNRIDEEYFQTILEEDFTFEGTIKIPDSLIIKGYVKGKVESNGLIIVGPKSTIDAELHSKNIQCFGKINGNVIVNEDAYFHSPSSINGDITTGALTVEKGCIINGKITMNQKEIL